MPIRTFILVLLALAALSGCGRRGDLEAPGAATSTSTAPPSNVSPLDPGAPAIVTPPPAQPQPARRHFFLDFLL